MRAIPTTAQTLAIEGGKPVRETLLPYVRQAIDEDDTRAVVEVLRSPWLTTGPKIGIRAKVCRLGGREARCCFQFRNGGVAWGCIRDWLRPGHEAITSPLTFVATPNSVLYQGRTPIFADVCADTLNVDPDRVSERITPKTRAILPVAYQGNEGVATSKAGVSERDRLCVHKARGWGEFRPVLRKSNPN